MKIHLLLFTFLISFIFKGLNAQTIDIPDENFKQSLLYAGGLAWDKNGQKIIIDENNDGKIQLEEALKIYRLQVAYNQITSIEGIKHFTNLERFDCYGNNLTELDISSLINLKILNCFENKIVNLDLSHNTNLERLDCSKNLTRSLNISNSNNLTYLNCNSNWLETLDLSYNTNLITLNCSYNSLTNLDLSNNINLTTVNCYSNKILTNLNVSNNTKITELNCSLNQLKKLEIFNLSELKKLYCYLNELVHLDISKNTKLYSLSCYDNELIHLDVSQNSELYSLSNWNNKIAYMDVSTLKKLDYFQVGSSSLKTLILKGSKKNKTRLSMYGSSNLEYICIDEDQIVSAQQNIDNLGLTNVVINSYCNFINPEENKYSLLGKSKLNLNHTSCEQNEEIYPNLKFSIDNSHSIQNFISNESGNYTIYFPEGIYTIIPKLENLSYFTFSPSSFRVDTQTIPDPTIPLIQNFCITPIGTHNDLEISIIPVDVARPGFESQYKIIYKNKGNTTLSGNITLQYPSNFVNFISSSPVNSSHNIGTLVWNYSNLKAFDSGEIMANFKVSPPPTINNGDVLSFSAQITPVEKDETEQDNSFDLKQTVVGSFDPNDKTCLEGNTITPDMVGEYIHYLIRFENTGTYYAENVVVKDIIDTSKFDISTLQITDASHPQYTKITKNTVEFIFEGIKLPHTDPERHGYIAFKIKTLPTLSIGDKLKNQADIFFDYNLPITTNEALTYIEEKTLAVDDINKETVKVSLYPNPAIEVIYFSSKENIKKAEIFDVNGRLIRVSQISNNQLNINTLHSGVYFITLYSEKGNKIQSRFIKK